MKSVRFAVVAAGGIAAVSAAWAAKTSAPTHQAVIFSLDDAKYTPVDPKAPDGPQLAVAYGDPEKGPGVFYLKMKQGPMPIHSHTADYHAVLVKGSYRHWQAKDGDTGKVLKVGDYWFQPGKQQHGDECLSDECILLVHTMGKFDFIEAKTAAPAKGTAKP